MNSGSNYDPRYNAKVYIPKAQRHVPVTPVEAPEPAPKATPQKPQQAHRAVRTLRISPQRQNAVTTESPIYGGKKTRDQACVRAKQRTSLDAPLHGLSTNATWRTPTEIAEARHPRERGDPVTRIRKTFSLQTCPLSCGGFRGATDKPSRLARANAGAQRIA